ncbi:MAG: c-type cytochrome [Acidobacteriota bacterium]
MHKLLRPLLVALVALPFLWASSARADGKEVFTKYKCAACHSVTSQGITKQKDDAAAAEEPGDAGSKPVEPPDLSKVGATRDAAWIKDWITKKNDIDGRKHKKRWTGKDDELGELATWLASLK